MHFFSQQWLNMCLKCNVPFLFAPLCKCVFFFHCLFVSNHAFWLELCNFYSVGLVLHMLMFTNLGIFFYLCWHSIGFRNLICPYVLLVIYSLTSSSVCVCWVIKFQLCVSSSSIPVLWCKYFCRNEVGYCICLVIYASKSECVHIMISYFGLVFFWCQ